MRPGDVVGNRGLPTRPAIREVSKLLVWGRQQTGRFRIA